MLGYFKVVDEKGNELGRYKYTSVTNRQKRFLKNKKGITIYCCCGNEDIEMRISSDLRIYPANQNIGEMHQKGCPKYIYHKKEDLWTRQTTESSIYYHVAASYATASDYAIKVNEVTYTRLIHPTYRLPDNYKEYNKRIQNTLKYIKTASGEILYNIAINDKKISEIPEKKEYFVYGMLKHAPVIKEYGNKKILFLDISDCYGKTKRYYANIEVYKSETDKLFKGSKNIVVCGFAYKKSKQSKILTLSDFCVKSINDIGTFTSI